MLSIRHTSRSEFLSIRDVQYHVRHWGAEDAPMLWMLHGWMDVSASFQFVVDALAKDWHIISPDWRGFGLSDRQQSDTYVFYNYLADLDALLQHYSPNQPVSVVGHSMGGNILLWYAGVCPNRIRHAINLEGIGLMTTESEDVPEKYAKWLAQLRHSEPLRVFPSIEAVAKRLQKTNPRLSDAKALWIANVWAKQNDEGAWELLADPAHKRVHPVPYKLNDAMACWEAIQAPVLWVEGEGSDLVLRHMSEDLEARRACIAKLEYAVVEDSGHMLHHDQPEKVAQLIESFLHAHA